MNEETEAEGSYCREIELHFQRQRGTPLLISNEDFERVRRWHAEGMPLFLVLDAIDAVFRRAAERRPRRRPLTLAYCEPAVREAFDAWREGRVGAGPEAPAAPSRNAAALERAITAVIASTVPEPARERAVSALRSFVADGLSGAALTEDVGRVAAELLDACHAALDPASARAISDAARAELAPYAREMDSAVHERALSVAEAQRVRRHFGLPDLSLLPLD